jgi:DNA-binding protein H-NS
MGESVGQRFSLDRGHSMDRRDFYFRQSSPLTERPVFALTNKADKDVAFLVGDRQMPKPNLSSLSVDELLKLRGDINKTLDRKANELRSQLSMLGVQRTGSLKGQRRGPPKGRKVPPKYRSPSGDTWAGRGARPRWLVAAIKGGKELDDFLIDKSAKRRRKRRSKR